VIRSTGAEVKEELLEPDQERTSEPLCPAPDKARKMGRSGIVFLGPKKRA
jgi:hypothetical protein